MSRRLARSAGPRAGATATTERDSAPVLPAPVSSPAVEAAAGGPAPPWQATRGAGLYIHVPFCSAVCPYCDFAVTTGGRERRAAFVERLIEEARLHAGSPLSFDTVYLGGGTPSSLEPGEIHRIIEACRRHLRLDPDARVHLEANPEDVTPRAAEAWRAIGAGTLSLGVQSFDAAELRLLGRRHSPEDARRSIAIGREAGFPTVSIDLIYGLPRQRVDAWTRSLDEAARAAPDHVSAYQLTVHEGTAFGRKRDGGRLVELGEADQARFFEMTHDRLEAAGFRAYEVSSFAREPRHRSRHNRKYWSHVPYLGIGPSAHSFHGLRRWWNERDVERWAERVARGERPTAGGEDLAPDDLALEAVMLGLRTRDGIDLESFHALHGLDLLDANRVLVESRERAGLLVIEGGRLRLTRRGWALADGIAAAMAIERS